MIRKATIEDLPAIYSLYQSFSLDVSRMDDTEYMANVQQDGFLLALDSEEDIKERMRENVLFNVYEENGEVLGFIVCNKEIYFPEEAGNVVWLEDTLKDNYFHSETSIALHEIIVDKKYQGKGVATKLLEEAITTLQSKKFTDIYSIVTIGPVTNCPSIIFHTKCGFQRACITNPIDLFGLSNYESLLFHKEI